MARKLRRQTRGKRQNKCRRFASMGVTKRTDGLMYEPTSIGLDGCMWKEQNPKEEKVNREGGKRFKR